MSRRSREELRTLMIEAGCELVSRRGLAFDPPSLTYANVFQHLEETRDIRLHRSQVHGRIWDSQDHYRSDVVVEAIHNVLPGARQVDEIVAGLARSETVNDLRAFIEGWIAAGMGVDRVGLVQDPGFDIFVAARALSHKDSATSAEVSAEATAHMDGHTRDHVRRFDTLTNDLDLGFVDDLGLDRATTLSLLARNSSALVEGSHMVDSVHGTGPETFEVRNSEGRLENIGAATLGLMLLVGQLLDLDG